MASRPDDVMKPSGEDHLTRAGPRGWGVDACRPARSVLTGRDPRQAGARPPPHGYGPSGAGISVSQARVLGIRVIRMILAVPIAGPIAVAFGACTRHGIDCIQWPFNEPGNSRPEGCLAWSSRGSWKPDRFLPPAWQCCGRRC